MPAAMGTSSCSTFSPTFLLVSLFHLRICGGCIISSWYFDYFYLCLVSPLVRSTSLSFLTPPPARNCWKHSFFVIIVKKPKTQLELFFLKHGIHHSPRNSFSYNEDQHLRKNLSCWRDVLDSSTWLLVLIRMAPKHCNKTEYELFL